MEQFNVYRWIENIKKALKNEETALEEYKKELKTWMLEYGESSSMAVKTYEAGTILYRGRIYEERDRFDRWHNYEDYKALQFAGYDEDGSFVAPKELCNVGRCNVGKQQCLYAGEKKESCYAELRPQANQLISIAEIIVDSELKILDLSMSGVVGNSNEMVMLFLELDAEMNRPIRSDNGYRFTQFVSKCASEVGFDGVRYTSAFSSITNKDAGKNIAIYNFDKCRAISSKLVLVENIEVHVKEK